MDWMNSSGVWWLIAAVALAITELMVPGVYLVFFAFAAAATGLIALLFPDLAFGAQLVGFAAWSVVAVLIGKRWYHDFPVPTSDPKLNDRIARLVGQTVTIVDAIEGGRGRVRVGDGEWPAHGPDLPAGTRVRVTGADGGTLTVEAVPQLESPAT